MSSLSGWFEGRTLLIATKHGKEVVIGPAFNQAFSLDWVVTTGFDTDDFGTFTGEIERPSDPISTVRSKCVSAMVTYGSDLCIASEGSFGPHPTLFGLPSDEEIIILIDKKNNLELLAKELSLETNFNAAEVHTEKELNQFVDRALFPEHALIVRSPDKEKPWIEKGIKTREELWRAFYKSVHWFGSAIIETDMRAFHNPTRMKVIEKATRKLIQKILQVCPTCGMPGFDIVTGKDGLPCLKCNMPTRSIESTIHVCGKCGYFEEKRNPTGKTHEDPMFCDYCNP